MKLLPALLIAAVTLATPVGAQPVPDHLKCYKAKDSAPKASYTADLGGLVAEPGCIIKVPGNLLCVEATKTNITPTPPGGPDTAGPAGRFLCYKIKCPKAALPAVQWNDQFGTRTVTPKTPKIVCAPEIPIVSTTTSTTSTSTASTTTTASTTITASTTTTSTTITTTSTTSTTSTTTITCPTGQTLCGTTCVNLQTDPNDCAACGHVCAAPTGGAAACSGGACAGSCPAGNTLCGAGVDGGGSCVDLQTDPNHCGACAPAGGACPMGVCSDGVCLYAPAGVQANVAVSTVTGGGWSQCYLDTYSINMSTSTVLGACTKARLMLACRPTGASTLQTLAWAARTAVTTDTGPGSTDFTTTTANNVQWYFDSAWSWGFLPVGDTFTHFTCDTTTTTDSSLRLCWDTTGTAGGYRCGTNRALAGSTAFERIVYQAD